MAEKFISPEPEPNRRERELLTCLIEECAEVQQRACKMKRFGMAEVQPGQEQTNADRLAVEVGDLLAVINILIAEKVIDETVVEMALRIKPLKLAKYLQTEKGEES